MQAGLFVSHTLNTWKPPPSLMRCTLSAFPAASPEQSQSLTQKHAASVSNYFWLLTGCLTTDNKKLFLFPLLAADTFHLWSGAMVPEYRVIEKHCWLVQIWTDIITASVASLLNNLETTKRNFPGMPVSVCVPVFAMLQKVPN